MPLFSPGAILGAQAATSYKVSNSLRFRLSASAYLSRTPASAGNRQKWTWSGWVKLGALGSNRTLFSCGTSYSQYGWMAIAFGDNSGTGTQIQLAEGANGALRRTNAVFRDPSAFYHVVVVFDSTQATAANRANIYVNGVVQTYDTNLTITQNTDYGINQALAHNICTNTLGAGTGYFDGYLAEVNFIDGQALDPTSFGEYDTLTGVWGPKACTVTDYGKNGFYLPFSDSANIFNDKAAIATNHSAANNWTASGLQTTSSTLTTYDYMLDSPTNYADGGNGRGNYAVINPLNLWQSSGGTSVTNGNLQQVTTTSAATGGAAATIAIPSGKYYWEIEFNGVPFTNACGAGLYDTSVVLGGANSWVRTGHWILGDGGLIYINGAAGTASGTGAFAAGDIARFAFDGDTGKLWVGKNATWVGTPGTSGEVATISMSGKSFAPIVTTYSNTGGITIANFGQRPFAQTVPSGYSALNTQNLPTPTIKNGAQYMAAVTYTGNGSTQTITTSSSNSGNNPLGTTFQPDLVWTKGRGTATYNNHLLYNVITGTNKFLQSNQTAAETTVTDGLTAFNSNGFSLGAFGDGNTNLNTYVAWQWKAGGTGVSNTSGSITSTVSANVSAGFSVVTYTGNGTSGATVGHGLGVAPSMVIVKRRDNGIGSTNWPIYHSNLNNGVNPAQYYIFLNLTNAQASASTVWNNTAPTSSVFSLGTYTEDNGSGGTFVAYCFAPVAGYSAMGSFTASGVTGDANFIYTGFLPRFILYKRTDAASSWFIHDTSRQLYNVQGPELYPESSAAESTATRIDFLSNGFKVRAAAATNPNVSTATYIYYAVAENPFAYARAR